MSAPRILLLALSGLLALSAHAQQVGPYHLKAGDQVRMSVFQEPELLTEVHLTVSGEASFPLIGSVQLGGQTIKEAETAVTALYNTDYLVEPRISINLLLASAERVTIVGAVVKPGEISIPPNTVLDLVSAVDWAGGSAAHADEKRVELKRGERTQNYDLAKLRKKGAAQVPLQNGDRINIAANPFAGKEVMVTGEVKRPGPVQFPINGVLDLEMTIGIAGGLTPAADLNRITVKRRTKIFSASLTKGNRPLEPGDVVSIPPGRFIGRTVTIMGQVSSPGQIPFPGDGKLDVLSAIARAGDFGRLANKKKVTVTRRTGDKNQSWRLDVTDMLEGKAQLFYLLPDDTVSVPQRLF